jgi:hypothetical protein
MATTDRTRDKLLASMRKSKAGAGSKSSSTASATPAKKTATRRKTANPAVGNKPPALAAAAMGAETRQASSDPYQSTGRIWPD